MSRSWQRARAAMMGRRTASATCCTPRRSPCEAAGKPASMTSTPSASSWRARRSLASGVIAFPGACSPSRSVVSKMITSLAMASSTRVKNKKAANLWVRGGGTASYLVVLDSALHARLEPSPEQCKAQEQNKAEEQRKESHRSRLISTDAAGCQERWWRMVKVGGGWWRLFPPQGSIQLPSQE